MGREFSVFVFYFRGRFVQIFHVFRWVRVEYMFIGDFLWVCFPLFERYWYVRVRGNLLITEF